MALSRKEILRKLKVRYKLVVLNDATFEEKASWTLNGYSAMVAISTMVVLLLALVMTLIIFTPLKEYIPGYADVGLRRDVTRLISKSDSLQAVQNARDNYFKNLRAVLLGRAGVEALDRKDKPALINNIDLDQKRPQEDQKLREMIEEEEKSNPMEDGDQTALLLAGYEFVTPIKGVVTDKFKPSIQHYAIDVACKKGAQIKATLEGTVIMAAYTKETGNVIVLQHEANLISIYKHCSALLKKVDNFVKSGEVIAVAGDTGEYTTGPHLHFELWQGGRPINPQEYMKF